MKQSNSSSTQSWGKKSAGPNSPLVMKSPRSPSVDTTANEVSAPSDESDQRKLESFAAAIEQLTNASVLLTQCFSVAPSEALFRGLQEIPVTEVDLQYKGLLMQVGSFLLKSETLRESVLSQLSSDVAIPMKQFLRVDVASIREMQDRVEVAKSAMDEAQLRYDIARSSNKKKAVVEKLSSELESCKRTHSLLRMNLASKLKEFEARQRFDIMQRLLRFMGNYGAMFSAMQSEFAHMADKISGAVKQLEEKKGAWDMERSQVDVSEIIAAEMMEMEISRQGYVDVGHGNVGSSIGRAKKLWMVASQGMMYWYQTWKDESPKQNVDLVLCSVKSLPDEPESFVLTSPTEQFSIKCQTAEEAEAWMEVIRKSIQYKLKMLQEEKRRNDPNSVPDYLKEMQMLSPDNKLCADCGHRSAEWASMTLGVVVCDNCAGVHRSLGTHISRIRSLSIDMWPPEQYYLMKQYGNNRANPIWEFSLASDKINKRLGGKPTPQSTREERELFVRSKYVEKRWLQPAPEAWRRSPRPNVTEPISQLELAEKLYDFGSKNDLKGLFLALAHGANPAHQLESGLSVFHQLVREGFCDVYSLQKLLLHTSGDAHKKSSGSGLDALHLAAHHDRALVCKFLIAQGFDVNSKTSSGLTAKDLAVAANAKSVIAFFETGEVPAMKEEQFQVDQLQKQAKDLIDRISKKLAEHREVLKDAGEDKEDVIFDLAKQIRMVKIGMQQMERDKLM